MLKTHKISNDLHRKIDRHEHPDIGEKVHRLESELRNLSKKTTKSISLSNIGVVGYRLIEPLQVTVTFEEDVYVAVSYDLNMYGDGDTEVEAIQDLRESLVEYYEDLIKEQNNLGKIPKSDFEYLNKILIKES